MSLLLGKTRDEARRNKKMLKYRSFLKMRYAFLIFQASDRMLTQCDLDKSYTYRCSVKGSR